MAKQVSILQPSDVAALRKAHAALTAFLVANDGPPARAAKAPQAPALTKSGKPRKPTGAAAHKKNAKPKAAGKKPKSYPPVVFDEQQQATLAEQQAAAQPAESEPVAATS